MKTTKRILAMLFVAATMVFAACEKDNKDDKPVTPVDPSDVMELNGTSWEADIANTYMYQGQLQMDISLHFVLDFISKTECEMFTDLSVEVPAYPQYNQSDNGTEMLTYTFDGTYLIGTYDDGEADTLTFNRADTTFTMKVPMDDDDDMSLTEMLGTDKVIFHRTR